MCGLQELKIHGLHHRNMWTLPLPLFLFYPTEMGSLSDKSCDKDGHVSFDSRQVDTGAQLVAGVTSELDPYESLRIR